MVENTKENWPLAILARQCLTTERLAFAPFTLYGWGE